MLLGRYSIIHDDNSVKYSIEMSRDCFVSLVILSVFAPKMLFVMICIALACSNDQLRSSGCETCKRVFHWTLNQFNKTYNHHEKTDSVDHSSEIAHDNGNVQMSSFDSIDNVDKDTTSVEGKEDDSFTTPFLDVQNTESVESPLMKPNESRPSIDLDRVNFRSRSPPSL